MIEKISKGDSAKITCSVVAALSEPGTKVLFMCSTHAKSQIVIKYLHSRFGGEASMIHMCITFFNGSSITVASTTNKIMGADFHTSFIDEYCDTCTRELAKVRTRLGDATISYYNMEDIYG